MSQVLEFENASADAVHVFLKIEGSYFRLSRVEPLSRVTLRLPATIASKAGVVVVPAGHLGAFRVPLTAIQVGYSTERLTITDLTAQVWRFSGSLLTPNGLAGRRF